ncbi:MAG TPA: DUF2934 domain-containing protein [Nevskiaceae bacterium]|nr:DUF2934 domain-containing protein [Nevskiaceae bacterium]
MDRNQDRKTAGTSKSKPASPAAGKGNIAGSMVAPVVPKDDGSREARIAREAYYRAERRGFAPGKELDDWLEAERELEQSQAAKH